jgi:hypothetical protein
MYIYIYMIYVLYNYICVCGPPEISEKTFHSQPLHDRSEHPKGKGYRYMYYPLVMTNIAMV